MNGLGDIQSYLVLTIVVLCVGLAVVGTRSRGDDQADEEEACHRRREQEDDDDDRRRQEAEDDRLRRDREADC